MQSTDASAPMVDFNPFIYNAPVRGGHFFNRDETLEKLLNETVTRVSQGNVWITGERQVGKTSLLRHIQAKYENQDQKVKLYGTDRFFDTAFIYLNAQDISSRDDFYRLLRHGLKNYFDFKIDPLQDPYESFIQVMTHLHLEQKTYIVFLLDEFDAYIENLAGEKTGTATAFLAEWNKIIQGISEIKNGPKVFGCIFAANNTVEELVKENNIKRRGSGLLVEAIELPWFSQEQVTYLAFHYLNRNTVSFSLQETEFCYKMTNGYPYFVQKLYSIMYDLKRKSPPFTDYLEGVEKVYGQTFSETVKAWGGASIPARTLEKIKTLSGDVFKQVRDQSVQLMFKGIEAYVKSELGL